MNRALPALVGGLLLANAAGIPAQSLNGSRLAMQRQHAVARKMDYTFLRNAAQVRKFVASGLLVPVPGNGDYELDGVSFPYARPALKTFVVRLAQQYRSACGEKLVVTSLTRPLSDQPRNASDLSVHPAGMAVDLRISRRASCQRWLASTLIDLEKRGVLDATREQRPPHFHVAVFPEKYLAYVRKLGGAPAVRLASSTSKPATADAGPAVAATSGPSAGDEAAETGVALTTVEKYRVNRGDSLWTIARRFGTTVEQIKEMNNLRTSRIAAGQVISVPASSIAP
jgi:hypothetical protein